MIEKLDPELLESNKKHYERELARPRFDFYGKVRSVDGRESSIETAAFCNSVENFLAVYKTISETLGSNSYLEGVGKSKGKRAFVNIFSLYAAASEAANKIRKFSNGNTKVKEQIEFHPDFSLGNYSLVDQILVPFTNHIKRIDSNNKQTILI